MTPLQSDAAHDLRFTYVCPHGSAPPGDSANPTSPHWGDTLDPGVEDRYELVPFERDVEAATMRTVVLDP